MEKKYVGMVGLHYKNTDGIPLTRYVMAFHSTSKDLKRFWLPGCNVKDVHITKES